MFDEGFFNNLLGQNIGMILRGSPTVNGVVVATFGGFVVLDTGFRLLMSEIVAVDVTGAV